MQRLSVWCKYTKKSMMTRGRCWTLVHLSVVAVKDGCGRCGRYCFSGCSGCSSGWWVGGAREVENRSAQRSGRRAERKHVQRASVQRTGLLPKRSGRPWDPGAWSVRRSPHRDFRGRCGPACGSWRRRCVWMYHRKVSFRWLHRAGVAADNRGPIRAPLRLRVNKRLPACFCACLSDCSHVLLSLPVGLLRRCASGLEAWLRLLRLLRPGSHGIVVRLATQQAASPRCERRLWIFSRACASAPSNESGRESGEMVEEGRARARLLAGFYPAVVLLVAMGRARPFYIPGLCLRPFHRSPPYIGP